MGLIKTLCQSSFQFHSQFRSSSNFPNHSSQFYVSLKPPPAAPPSLWTIATLHWQKISKYPFHLTKLQVSRKPSAPTPPVSRMPISNLSKITKRLAKFLSEKMLTSLVGAFVLMGSFCFDTRIGLPLLARACMEEKRDTNMENSEQEQLWDELLEREPRNVEALKVVVHSKMSKGQVEDAFEYVRTLIEIEPREVEWRLLEALCYEMMGQLGKAKRLFKEILKQRPLLLRALHGLAMVMHKNFEGPAVFEMLNKALELARRDKRVTEERNIRILIAQMHVVQVSQPLDFSFKK
uniref:Uncharacterized protein MANES_S022800 n=1 Tax=Rhizophora mucronata TaxID=61149 RepID=A0A2P2J1T0_RHIMU